MPRGDRDRLVFLASCLGFDGSAATAAALHRMVRAADFPWREIVAFANRELLAPTLWVRLRDRNLVDALPRDVALYLRRTHAVNSVRNDRLRSELVKVARALNEHGIEPVLLKGAVDLLVSRYRDPGARILRDLDLFVPKADLERAVAALKELGYREAPRDAGRFVTYYVELIRPDAMACLDLQWFISAQRDVLPPEDAYRDSVAGAVAGARFRTLSPAHQIVHNVLHSELQDRGADSGFVWLRQLHDLAAICRHHGDAVIWPEVQACFARRGLAGVLSKRLYMAHRLLGLPMPPGQAPTLAATLHYQRCLAQVRWRWVMSVMRLWATLTSPLDPRLLDVIYGSGTSRRRIAIERVRHGARLLSRYRGNLFVIVRKRRSKFD